MGTVYFLHALRSNSIKVGFSQNLKNRLNKLKAASPEPLITLKTIKGHRQLEQTILTIFAKFRTHGEWFEARDELFVFINSLEENKIYEPYDLVVAPFLKTR